MSIRSDLLTHLSTSLAGTSVTTASELPWESGGVALYDKNMKKLYVDQPTVNINTLHRIIAGNDVCERETLVDAYFTVDAKNQPADIETVLETLIAAKDIILSHHINECDVDRDIVEDRITYTISYRFVKIN